MLKTKNITVISRFLLNFAANELKLMFICNNLLLNSFYDKQKDYWDNSVLSHKA